MVNGFIAILNELNIYVLTTSQLSLSAPIELQLHG